VAPFYSPPKTDRWEKSPFYIATFIILYTEQLIANGTIRQHDDDCDDYFLD
jgi:hypothetical protein